MPEVRNGDWLAISAGGVGGGSALGGGWLVNVSDARGCNYSVVLFLQNCRNFNRRDDFLLVDCCPGSVGCREPVASELHNSTRSSDWACFHKLDPCPTEPGALGASQIH